MPKDYPLAFATLRDMLKKHSTGLRIIADTPAEFTVVTHSIGPNGQPMWFGCVKVGKSAVSYHLMPLYFNPKLEATIPDELRPRKQGKTCFNFQSPDDRLFAMLDELTRTAREQWQRQGLLEPGPVSPEKLAGALRAAGVDPDKVAAERAKKGKQAAAKRAATLRKREPDRPGQAG